MPVRRLEQNTKANVSKVDACVSNQMNTEVEQALQPRRGHICSEAEREIHEREVRSQPLQRQ